jgi:hypothetical protein
MGKNVVALLVYLGDQSKAAAGWTAKRSGCNKLWSVCAVDPTGPVSKDAGEQSPGPRPAVGESSCPPRGLKGGKPNEQYGTRDMIR